MLQNVSLSGVYSKWNLNYITEFSYTYNDYIYLLQTRGHPNWRRWSCFIRSWHLFSHVCSDASVPIVFTNCCTKLLSSAPSKTLPVKIKVMLHKCTLVFILILLLKFMFDIKWETPCFNQVKLSTQTLTMQLDRTPSFR